MSSEKSRDGQRGVSAAFRGLLLGQQGMVQRGPEAGVQGHWGGRCDWRCDWRCGGGPFSARLIRAARLSRRLGLRGLSDLRLWIPRGRRRGDSGRRIGDGGRRLDGRFRRVSRHRDSLRCLCLSCSHQLRSFDGVHASLYWGNIFFTQRRVCNCNVRPPSPPALRGRRGAPGGFAR